MNELPTTAPVVAPTTTATTTAEKILESEYWRWALYFLIILSLYVGFVGRPALRKECTKWDLKLVNREIYIGRLHVVSRLLWMLTAACLVTKLVYKPSSTGDEWRAFVAAFGAALLLTTQVPPRNFEDLELIRKAILAPSFAVETLSPYETPPAVETILDGRPFVSNEPADEEANRFNSCCRNIGSRTRTSRHFPCCLCCSLCCGGALDEPDEETAQAEARQQEPDVEGGNVNASRGDGNSVRQEEILVPLLHEAHRNWRGYWAVRQTGRSTNSRR